MGNSTATGSQPIVYSTRDNIPIQYIYYDLKGKNRFPPEPSDREIEYMFEKCLKDIIATPQNLQKIRDFNSKYKFRFVILHGRKLEEYKEKHELNRLRRTHNFDENQFKGIEEKRKKELEEKLQLLENNETAIKMHLGAIDRFISQKNAWTEFIQIKGIERLVKILNKAIQTNKQGTRTIFQNQIEILKMLKSLSDHNPKEYFQVVSKLSEYTIILMRAYHPVNVAVTAYVLLMLQDYNWKVENGLSMLETLRAYQAENQLRSFLDPFVQAIYETNNILMCFYNLRFINEMLISIVDDNDKRDFQNQLQIQRYELLIVDVTQKLQDNFYKIQNSTFQAVSQQIYKYATRAKKDKQNFQELLMNRATTQNLDLLHQHLLVNFVDGFITNNQSQMKDMDDDDDDDDDYMTVHVPDNDKKCFHKFIVDTFSEIQHYYKYSVIIDQFQEGGEEGQIPQEFQKMKNFGLSCQAYVKRIKGSCMKNGCEDLMLNCFKAMQYFQKSQWKRLETFVLEDIKIQHSAIEVENYKKQLQEKEKEIKTIKKEFYQLKTEMVNMSKIQQPKSNPNVSKLDMTLFELDKPEVEKGVHHQPKKLEIPSSLLAPININTLSNVLPPPLNDPLANNNQILPPPPTLNGNILPPPPTLNGHILPPPPTLNTNILPPPPTLGNILPPPPTLNLGGGLPPPPNMNNEILPPSPGLNTQILPPPPSLTTQILPPPPSLNGDILPPPPSLNIGGLPPPPTLNIGGLPPPPSLNFGGLPPPPSNPDLGIPNLGLPSIPNIGGLPSIGGLPPLGDTLFPQIVEKLKEKRKPKVTMKNCNYKTLTYSEIQKTIWSQIDDTKVSLDQTQLQTLFSRAVAKELIKVQSAIQISSEPKKKETIKLLGPDRWRNMEIVLTKLKLPEGAITEALTTCSGKYAVPNVLESLKGLIPTEQEQMMVSNYDGDVEDLGKPEKFLKELISIPEYANRVKSILFSGMREELFFELQQNIEHLTTAFQALKNDNHLHYVLQVALAVGNYLNGTGIKGGAWGFKLDTLERLEEVKSPDNKMNAGLYIIKEVWKKYKYPIFEKDEVDMYQFISKMPISQVKIDLAEIKKYAVAVEKAFNSKKKDNPNDRIDEHCEEMLLEVKSKYVELEGLVKKLEEAYNDCATYYCEDPSKASSDQIGKKLFKSVLFIFNTEKIYYELEERRKKEEARKAVKNQVKFNEKTEFKKEPLRVQSEQSKPISNISPVKLPMPPLPPPIKSGITEMSEKQKLKEIEKAQQEKEKKYLEEMMKKRTSKMVAFRQSKAPNGGSILRRNDPEIDFLKGL